VINMSLKIIETGKSKFNNPVAITGFPDVGLVGSIAVSHIVSAMNLKEIGYIESDKMPPIIVVHDKRPKSPMRLYGNNEFIVAISEIPIPHTMVYELSHALVDWFISKDVKMTILLGGLAVQKRMEVEEPGVYGVSTTKKTDNILKKNKIKFFDEGYIKGQDGITIRRCMEKGLESIYLMAEAHSEYPDPGAAASIVRTVNKLLNLNLDVKTLLESEEQIRMVTRDLMRRTKQTMKKTQNIQDQEIPAMYG